MGRIEDMKPTTHLWKVAGEALDVTFRAAPGCEIQRTPHGTMALSGEPVADLNAVLIGPEAQAKPQLQAFRSTLGARQVPYMLFLSEAVADQVASIAREMGLENAGTIPLMTLRSRGVEPSDDVVNIERVIDDNGVAKFGQVCASAFDLPIQSVGRAFGADIIDGPGLDLFLANRNGAAASCVLTMQAGRTVGIWCMGTIPDWQRQGIGRALLSHVINHYCKDDNETTFYLFATEAGLPLYRSIGFQTVEAVHVWVHGHSTQV